jgi:hypothetical protein
MRNGRASKALHLVSISWLDLYPARSVPARRLLLVIHEAYHSIRLFLQSRPQMPIFVACMADDASRSYVSYWELRVPRSRCNGAGLIPASGIQPARIGWPSECVRRPTSFVLAHAGI